jgi:hypothetical protein
MTGYLTTIRSSLISPVCHIVSAILLYPVLLIAYVGHANRLLCVAENSV